MPPRSLLIAALLLPACSDPAPAPAPQDIPAERIEAVREASRALGSQLRSELVAAMQSGGPIAAVDICKLRAPAIADSVSLDSEMRVGRTALRVRNPANAPDDWEQAQLGAFLTSIEAGEDPASLSAAEIVELGDGSFELRWMAPIMMDGACAVCHGEALAPDLAEAIAERYPEDEATGFHPGELRGAFTVSAPLD